MYVHAMRFHAGVGAHTEKLTKKEMENELLASEIDKINLSKDNDQEGDNKGPGALLSTSTTTAKSFKKPEGFKALTDWKTLM